MGDSTHTHTHTRPCWRGLINSTSHAPLYRLPPKLTRFYNCPRSNLREELIITGIWWSFLPQYVNCYRRRPMSSSFAFDKTWAQNPDFPKGTNFPNFSRKNFPHRNTWSERSFFTHVKFTENTDFPRQYIEIPSPQHFVFSEIP